jgi:hypothetical protein
MLVCAAGLVAALLLVGYLVWSSHVWSGYTVSYENWRSATRTAVDKTLELPASSEQERSRKLAAFKGLSETIGAEQGTICHVNGLVGWQRFMSNLKAYEEKCQSVADAILSFNTSIRSAVDYLNDEQATTKIIVTATSGLSDKVTETAWEKQATMWHSAVESAAKLKTSSKTFLPVKNSVVEKAGSIETAWKGLVAANQAKNKAQYVDAQTKLTEAYGSLVEVNTLDVRQFSTLTSSLQSQYRTVFNN